MENMAISASLLRLIQLGNRFLQWASSIIILGVASHWIDSGIKDTHTVYTEVIAALSAVAFLPGLALGFIKSPVLGRAILPIDVIFSYLWLTSFIFFAQSFGPHGSALQAAAEAFSFLAFFFTFTAVLIDIGFIFPKTAPGTTGVGSGTKSENGATTGNGTSTTATV